MWTTPWTGERRLEQRESGGDLGEAGADSACSSGTQWFLAAAGAVGSASPDILEARNKAYIRSPL